MDKVSYHLNLSVVVTCLCSSIGVMFNQVNMVSILGLYRCRCKPVALSRLRYYNVLFFVSLNFLLCFCRCYVTSDTFIGGHWASDKANKICNKLLYVINIFLISKVLVAPAEWPCAFLYTPGVFATFCNTNITTLF